MTHDPHVWAALFAGLAGLQLVSFWVLFRWQMRQSERSTEEGRALLLLVSEHRDEERKRLLALVDEVCAMRGGTRLASVPAVSGKCGTCGRALPRDEPACWKCAGLPE